MLQFVATPGTMPQSSQYDILIVVKSPHRNRASKFAVRTLAIAAGLCGGWLLAGSLNSHRVDLPVAPPPATQPATAHQ